MPLHILYSDPQIESLNKQTYANNANLTAICLNRIVCKECSKIRTSLAPKIMKENSHCSKCIRAYYAKGFNILSHSEFPREFLQQR